MATYIDFNAAVNGVGTQESPYNGISELNARAGGDLLGEITYFKRGTVLVDGGGLVISSDTWNMSFLPYGDSSLPLAIIDCSWPSGTWQTQGLGNYSNNNLNDGGRQRAAIVDGVKVPNYETKAEMENSNFGTWFDGATTWINIGGINPNTVPTRMTGEINGFLHAQKNAASTGQVFAGGFSVRFANGTGFKITECKDGNTFSGADSSYNGGWNSVDGPGDGFIMNGENATPAQANNIINNTGEFNNNNLIEAQDHTGLVVEYNVSQYNSTGLEFWGYVQNSFIRYNTVKGAAPSNFSTVGNGSAIWLAPPTANPGVTGFNNANEIAYNIISESGPINIGNGNDDNLIYNNLHLGLNENANGNCVLNGDGLRNEFCNNLFQLNSVAGLNSLRFMGENNASSTTTVIKNNNFCFLDNVKTGGSTQFKYAGNNYTDVTTLEAAQANVQDNIIGVDVAGFGVDPEWLDDHYNIGSDSPMAYAGIINSQPLDYYGTVIDSSEISIGAVEVNNAGINTGNTGSDYDGYWRYRNNEFIADNSVVFAMNEGPATGDTFTAKDGNGKRVSQYDAPITNYDANNWELK